MAGLMGGGVAEGQADLDHLRRLGEVRGKLAKHQRAIDEHGRKVMDGTAYFPEAQPAVKLAYGGAMLQVTAMYDEGRIDEERLRFFRDQLRLILLDASRESLAGGLPEEKMSAYADRLSELMDSFESQAGEPVEEGLRTPEVNFLLQAAESVAQYGRQEAGLTERDLQRYVSARDRLEDKKAKAVEGGRMTDRVKSGLYGEAIGVLEEIAGRIR